MYEEERVQDFSKEEEAKDALDATRRKTLEKRVNRMIRNTNQMYSLIKDF